MKTGTNYQIKEWKLSQSICSISFVSILLIMAFMLSGSTMIPLADKQNEKYYSEKKLNLLEKLENGTKVSSEEISSSFCERKCNDSRLEEMHFNFDQSLVELKEEIRSIKNSEEFNNLKDEVRKLGIELKKEMIKLGDEMDKAVREGRVKSEVHNKV